MTMYPLRLDDEVIEAAKQAADEEKISLDQLLSAFIAHGVNQRRAMLALKRRAARGDPAAALAILERAPAFESDEGDKIDQSVSRGRT